MFFSLDFATKYSDEIFNELILSCETHNNTHRGVPWPRKGAAHFHLQLGLADKELDF